LPGFAHIANSTANNPLASLLVAIPISFALIVLSSRIWCAHGPFAVLLLAVSILFQGQRNLAFDSFLFAFPPLCRNIPTSRSCFA
jgi:hypothetical protein